MERVKKVMRKYMMWSDRVVVVRVKAVGNVRVVEVVKALEKEFRTILRRTIWGEMREVLERGGRETFQPLLCKPPYQSSHLTGPFRLPFIPLVHPFNPR